MLPAQIEVIWRIDEVDREAGVLAASPKKSDHTGGAELAVVDASGRERALG